MITRTPPSPTAQCTPRDDSIESVSATPSFDIQSRLQQSSRYYHPDPPLTRLVECGLSSISQTRRPQALARSSRIKASLRSAWTSAGTATCYYDSEPPGSATGIEGGGDAPRRSRLPRRRRRRLAAALADAAPAPPPYCVPRHRAGNLYGRGPAPPPPTVSRARPRPPSVDESGPRQRSTGN